jgi:hypothetical protein
LLNENAMRDPVPAIEAALPEGAFSHAPETQSGNTALKLLFLRVRKHKLHESAIQANWSAWDAPIQSVSALHLVSLEGEAARVIIVRPAL